MNRSINAMTLLTAAVISFTFVSCNFSKGVKKDLNTGLSASYNGISIDDIYLADSNESKMNSNKISLGNKVMVLATGADNFTVEQGKVFPGCQIILTDKDKNELLNLPDAFANRDNGVTPEETKNLKGIVYTGNPMVVGETYHLKVRFFDKKQRKRSSR